MTTIAHTARRPSFRSRAAVSGIGTAMLLLGGCAVFEDETERSFVSGKQIGDAKAMVTTADVRVITERQRVGTNSSAPRVVCTEPPPDVAKAVSAAMSLSASGGNGTVTGQLALSGSTAEALTELAGRSTALIGLRDGLYRACEAYANGAIGADAYALVLTRYGHLMTTLFLAQDMIGAAGTARGPAVSSPVVNVTTTNSPNAVVQADAAKDAKPKTTPNNNGSDGAADQSTSGSGDTQSSGAGNKSTGPTASASTKANDAAPAGQNAPAAPSNTAVLSLLRANQDFFGLALDPIGLLMVACINGYDSTRGAGLDKNTFLDRVCINDQAMSIQNILATSLQYAKIYQASLVDPTVGLADAKTGSKGGQAQTSWTIAFASASGTLDAKGVETVNAAATAFKAGGKSFSGVSVVGETDSTGDATKNQALAKQRADAVVAQLTAQGIDSKAIKVDTKMMTARAVIITLVPAGSGVAQQ